MELNAEHCRETTTKPGIRPLSSDSSDEIRMHKKREVKDTLAYVCFCGEALLQPKNIGGNYNVIVNVTTFAVFAT